MSRIDELYEKYLQPLKNMLSRNPDGEDVAQETLIAAWKRLERGAPIENERAYLAQAARNNANKRYTRAKAPRRGGGRITDLEEHHDAIDQQPTPEDEVVAEDEVRRFRAEFNAAMGALSADTQQCVVLRRHGLGSQEIAHRLGLTDDGVRSRLSRANAHFRARVSPPPDVPWLDLFGDDDDHKK